MDFACFVAWVCMCLTCVVLLVWFSLLFEISVICGLLVLVVCL